jgi:amidase
LLDSYSSAHDQIHSVREKEVSAQELVDQSLDRIATIDASGYKLKSVLALSKTTPAGNVDPRLPLAGIPILIKDNVEAVGLPGSAGSLALANHPVKADSPLVTRLKSAGAEIIGATNLSEWANIRSTKSTSGWSGLGGLTANPWQHGRSAGGSSSGSGAAIAAGMVALAVGTETDGSIICPASLNGCVGIKPTVGSVPVDGVIPISSSQDSPGPMARTVEDAALLLEIMMDRNDLVDASSSDRSLKIGFVKSWITGHAGTDALLEDAMDLISKSGISLLEIELSPPDEETGNDEYDVLLHELFDDLGSFLKKRTAGKLSSLVDLVRFNEEHSKAELHYFGQELFEKAIGLRGRTSGYAEKRARNLAWAQTTLNKGLGNFDVLIGATYSPAWQSTLGKGDDYSNSSWITMAPAIAGSPIGSIPMGITDGLPVGLGVVARKNDEATLVTAMKQIESVLALGTLKPTFLQ